MTSALTYHVCVNCRGLVSAQQYGECKKCGSGAGWTMAGGGCAIQFRDNAFTPQSVACPTCNAASGARCRRPSGHEAAQFHAERKAWADELFIRCYGEKAEIAYDESKDCWGVKDGGKFIAHATKAGRRADEEFRLANDPTPYRPARFDDGANTKQRVLITGLDLLPGQLDMF